MHILLMILKILGIVLLVLIGILILLLCAVLFIPVCYQATGELFEEKKFHIRGTWLFFVLRVVGEIEGKAVTVKIQLFGFPVFSYPKAQEPNKKRKKRRKKRSRRVKEKDTCVSKSDWEGKDTQQESEIEKELCHLEQSQIEKKKEKTRKSGKIKQILAKIGEWILMIPQKLKQLGKNLAHIKEMLYDENNKAAVTHGFQEIKYLLRHFGPRKILADLTFSTGDPAFTGQLLGVICIFPIIYQNDMHLIPDFESESAYVRGTFQIRGRIRFIHALCAGVRILKDKNIRNLIRK